MSSETKHGNPTPPDRDRIGCGEFEALLSEALDGQLTGSVKERFEAHRQVCAVCGPLFADAQAGQQWLRSLEDVEPPANLVHNILAATTGIESVHVRAAAWQVRRTPFAERAREWWDSFFTPLAAFVRQPRFVMSFGMIFFSFSLALSAAGVKPADVARIDLRPSALRHTYYTTQGRIVKFYENIRFVYEIESRVREFKRATAPAEPSREEPKENRKNNKTSGQPDQRQDRNYSREENQPVLAGLPDAARTLLSAQAADFELPAARYESGATRQPVVARSSQLEAGSSLLPPAVRVTTIRRFV